MLDTQELHAHLEGMAPEQRVAFSAACLEGIVGQFADSAPGSDLLPKELLGRSVDLCWLYAPRLPEDQVEVEGLYSRARGILEEDDEGRLLVGEHVLAAVCYAIRCLELRTSEYSVLVANNYYEAADYAVTINDPSLSDSEILATSVVSGVLATISATLSAVSSINAANAEELLVFRELANSFRGAVEHD